jgi:cytochrome c5
MCHTPLNALGSPKKRYYLTGGFIDGYWAPNITSHGLASASVQDVANVFKKGELINHAGPVAGQMAEVNHNSLRYLTDEDQRAIGVYLKTVVSEEPLGVLPSTAKPTLQRGKQVYVSACIICHQDNKMAAPVIGDSANWYRRLKSSGLTGLYRHSINGYNSMPVKGACVTCSDNDVIAAIDYLLNQSLSRSQWRDLSASGAEKYPASGKDVYQENCSACHTDGQHGAPKIGDTAVWESLIAQNMDFLVERTLNGQSHPKKGGCAQCTTGEVIDAIKYMLRQSKVKGNYQLW